jgi:hypothetical protein
MSSTTSPPTAGTASAMAELVEELSQVIERIRSQATAGSVSQLRGAALTSLTARLWESVDQLSAVATHATGELHRSGDLRDEGFVSTTQWLVRRVRLAEHDARAVVARATAMRESCTATWSAWNSGEVSGAAAREVSIGLTSVFRGQPAATVDAEAPLAERILLDVARAGTVADVRRAVETLRAAVDPDGTSAAALAAYDDQSLTCTAVGSMVSLRGYLDAESHAVMATALDQIIDGWYRTGALTPEDQPTDRPDHDRRQRRARRPHLRALALVELARRQLDEASLGTRHEAHPHVSLVVDVDRHAAGLPSELQVPGDSTPTLLGAESIRRILCDADTTVTVTTTAPASEATVSGLPSVPSTELARALSEAARTVLYVGRRHRRVTRRLRLALEIRDQRCAFPQCGVDVSRCHAHHVHHWEHGGGTDLDNMLLLCPSHHRLVHEGGWQIAGEPTRHPGARDYWTFTPPPRRTRP